MDRDVVARRLHAARQDLLDSKRRVEADEIVGRRATGELAEPRDDSEAAAELLEREMDQGLLDGFDARLAEIDAAEVRLAAGAYGYCEECGSPIGDERLTAIPWARCCVTHQRTAEQTRTGLRSEGT